MLGFDNGQLIFYSKECCPSCWPFRRTHILPVPIRSVHPACKLQHPCTVRPTYRHHVSLLHSQKKQRPWDCSFFISSCISGKDYSSFASTHKGFRGPSVTISFPTFSNPCALKKAYSIINQITNKRGWGSLSGSCWVPGIAFNYFRVLSPSRVSFVYIFP